MSNDKKYYWLKLKRDFFKRHDTMIIESMENGEKYLLFYLKLLVESIDHEGNLRFSDTIPYNDKMLATITNTDIDIVRSAVKIFIELNMMEQFDDGTLYMNQVRSMIGNETGYAEKKRIWREKQKQIEDKSETKKDNVRQEKELDIELDKDIDKDKDIINTKPTKENKHKYGEYNHVLLTDSQMISVVEKLGEHKTKYMIKVMDEAIEEKGNIWHISNFAMALLKWAKKDTSYKPPQQTTPSMPRLPRPPKCPTCGKPTIEYMYGGAGCKPCGIMYRYNDKWIREK